MSTLYMFSGSSSVGKSTCLNSVASHVDAHELTARTVRKKFGSPAWQDIINDRELADKIQTAQLDYFIGRVSEVVRDNADRLRKPGGRPMVFERSPWDVVGYSKAFNCSRSVVQQQLDKLVEFEDRLIDADINVVVVVFTIDPQYKYDSIPERPPEEIRDSCAKALKSIWHDIMIDRMSQKQFLGAISSSHAKVA